MMAEYNINSEAKDRTQINGSVGIQKVVVNMGGEYVLNFYNGQETEPMLIIENPQNGDEYNCNERFSKGITYTLIFSQSEIMRQKRCSVRVNYYIVAPPSISPLPLDY